MELGQFTNSKFEEMVSFSPKLPNGEDTDIVINIRSSRSDDLIQAIDKMSKAEQLARAKEERKGKIPLVSLTKEIQRDIDIACLTVVSFENIMIDGKELEVSDENIRMLMTELGWLRAQVIETSRDETLFFGI